MFGNLLRVTAFLMILPLSSTVSMAETVLRDVGLLLTRGCEQSPSIPEFGPFSQKLRGQLINGHYEYRNEFKNDNLKPGQSLKQVERYSLDIVDKNKLKFNEYTKIESYEPSYNKNYSIKLNVDQKQIRFNRNDGGRLCYIEIIFDEPPVINSTVATEIAKLDEKTKNADQELQRQIEQRKKEAEEAQKELDRINAEIAATKAQQQNLTANQQNLQSQQTATAKVATDTQNLLNNMKLPEFEPAADWVIHVPSIPIQQQQFCRMINQYRVELDAVELTQNEIKKNELFKARQLDIANLLPKGELSNWIVRVKEIKQAKNGDAEISVSLPCLAMMGSNTCNLNPEMYQGTIKQDSLMYREIAKLSANQFVALSAKLLFAVDPDTKKPGPEFAKIQPGVQCSGSEKDKNNQLRSVEKFVIEPANVVKLN